MRLAQYLVCLGFILSVSGCATEIMPGQWLDNDIVTFERGVEAPGNSSDEIYKGTNVWIAENFQSAKRVIELDSQEDGLIIGNGRIDYPCNGINCMGTADTASFTMRVDIKDERFRLSFTNIKLHYSPTSAR